MLASMIFLTQALLASVKPFTHYVYHYCVACLYNENTFACDNLKMRIKLCVTRWYTCKDTD